MSTPTDLRDLNAIWSRMAQLAGYDTQDFPLELITGASGSGGITTENMTLYCDPSGNDGNPGTLDQPCRQPAGALAKVPKRLRHLVDIRLAAGSYQGFEVSSFVAESQPGRVVGLRIGGDLIAATVATGSATGTCSSAANGSAATATFATLTDSTQTWTVNDLKGKFVTITSGALANSSFVITSNTSTQITVAGVTWSTLPTGATYSIQAPGAFISTSVNPSGPIPAYPATSAANGAVAINFTGCEGSITNRSFRLEKIGVSVAGAMVAAVGTQYTVGSVIIDTCTFSGQTSGQIFLPNGTGLMTIRNCAMSSGGTVSGVATGVNYSDLVGNISVLGCLFSLTAGSTAISLRGGTVTMSTSLIETSAGILLRGNARMQLTGGIRMTGCSVGIQTTTNNADSPFGCGLQSVSGLDISNCTTAVALDKVSSMVLTGNLSGSTNTTAFNLTHGARVQLSSGSTITGSSEIVMDGAAAQTIASMRAASPKLLTNTYGTIIFE